LRGGDLPRTKPTVLAKDIGPGLVKETDKYRITAAPADHVQPFLDSLAYRIDTDDGSLVITGDTKPCDSVVDLARGADVMMVMCWDSHDAMKDRPVTSCSILTAGELAAEAGVKQLTMVHIGPRLLDPELADANDAEARKSWGGDLVWGREGMVMPWPSN
jgi:ribonuclease BN (tRNA processing enzyme)